jgi:hypothetical protein
MVHHAEDSDRLPVQFIGWRGSPIHWMAHHPDRVSVSRAFRLWPDASR